MSDVVDHSAKFPKEIVLARNWRSPDFLCAEKREAGHATTEELEHFTFQSAGTSITSSLISTPLVPSSQSGPVFPGTDTVPATSWP